MTIFRNKKEKGGIRYGTARGFPCDKNLLKTKGFSENVSLHLGDKELVALLGVSGGGKTTLFNVISGILKPDSGQVLLDGEDITGRPGQVSYMLQKDLLLPYRTIEVMWLCP